MPTSDFSEIFHEPHPELETIRPMAALFGRGFTFCDAVVMHEFETVGSYLERLEYGLEADIVAQIDFESPGDVERLALLQRCLGARSPIESIASQQQAWRAGRKCLLQAPTLRRAGPMRHARPSWQSHPSLPEGICVPHA